MWHIGIRQYVMEDGQVKMSDSSRTEQELEEMPELATNVLLSAIGFRGFMIMHLGEGTEPLIELLKFERDWVCRTGIKSRGRPIKSRHTAIKALFFKMYFNKPWSNVTQRFCQCGQSHDNKSPDDKLRFKRCQDNIEAEVRHLKTALKKCGVTFPPARPKETQTTYEPPPIEYVRVPDTHAIQHPAIAIFVDGDSVPETEMTRGSLADESDAWYMFNPWEPGWIPMWFPPIRSEPIGTRKELQVRRLDWFDKVFKHFAGTDWPLKGSLESRRGMVADTLLRMYRAARAEEIPEEEIPKAEMPEEEIPEIDEL